MKKFAALYVKSSLQYGHLKKYWNPKMAPYIAYEKHGYYIFDLACTAKLLKIAGAFLQKKASEKAKFLFVGTSKVSEAKIYKYAIKSDAFFVNSHWLGGLLTNWSSLQSRIKRLNFLEKEEKEALEKNFSKKELSAIKKEKKKLDIIFKGIKDMSNLPSMVIFASPLENMIALEECAKLGIPTVGIVDTNCNPEIFTYPITANDDSSSSIDFILSYLSAKIISGRSSK